ARSLGILHQRRVHRSGHQDRRQGAIPDQGCLEECAKDPAAGATACREAAVTDARASKSARRGGQATSGRDTRALKATRRERSLIGLAILVAVGFLGYVYLFEPIQDWRQAGADLIPTREATLERRRLLVAQRPVIAAEIETANKRIEAMAPRWLKGPT